MHALVAVLSIVLAHDADLISVQYQREGSTVSERVRLTGGTLARLAPVDRDGDGALSPEELAQAAPALDAGIWQAMPLYAGAAACARESSSAQLVAGAVELSARFRCPAGELHQIFRVLSVLPSGYRVVVAAEGEGGFGQQFAAGDAQTVYLPEAAPRERVSGFLGWLRLGVFHIFTGFDHLAFLAALLLAATGWRRLLLMVTSFTVAHSITLGATALGVVSLDPTRQRWVEAAIAASILFVALENVVRPKPAQRAAEAFGFGLIHGFGFASALLEYGLSDAVVPGLLGFNLGVELGQACVVVALLPFMVWLSKVPPARRQAVVRGCSLVIAALGGYWMVQRLLG